MTDRSSEDHDRGTVSTRIEMVDPSGDAGLRMAAMDLLLARPAG